MANAPEHVPTDYSTLEVIQHHPELQARKDVEISNGVHDKQRFSTLESAPNSPDLGSKGNRYSTLESYSPDHNEEEKTGGGVGTNADLSETPEKQNWKSRRFCGVPLLVLLIGLVLVSVAAAIVGGVVGSKKISDDPKPDSQQNETPTPVTVTQTVYFVAGTSVTSPVAAASTTSSVSSAAPTYDEPWLTGQEDSIYNVKGFGGSLLVDNLKKPNWLIKKVSAVDQEIYKQNYPWGAEGPRQAYNIQAENASGPIYLTLDPEVATPGKIDTSGATTKKIPIKFLNQRETDGNPSARAWYFRSTTKEKKARDEYPLEIYNVFLEPMWKLWIGNSSSEGPQVRVYDQGRAEEYLWKLPSQSSDDN